MEVGILPLFSMLTLYCSTFFISVSAWPFQFNFSAPSLRSALKSPACSFAALLARFCMIDVHLNMTAFGGSQSERERERERKSGNWKWASQFSRSFFFHSGKFEAGKAGKASRGHEVNQYQLAPRFEISRFFVGAFLLAECRLSRLVRPFAV